MLRAIFGVNIASQGEHSSSNFPFQKQALVTEVNLPVYLEGSLKGINDAGFYQSCFKDFQEQLNQMFEEIRRREQTKERKR